MTSAGALELKHHVLNGRLNQAKRLLASTQISLEDCLDEDGNSALHWCGHGLQTEAAKREASDQEMFFFLLQNGAPKNAQNSLGETPLMAVVRMASLEPKRAEALVEELLSKGNVDPNRADISGETPLLEAAAAGLLEIGKLLLEYRANPLAESSTGLTAAQMADTEEFAQLLKSPLAVRAAQEARAEEATGRSAEERQREADLLRERHAKKFEQTLFGQKLRPGLAWDKDKPGKPYPEYGTLHDID